MLNALRIILTLLLFAGVLVALKKKLHFAVALSAVGVAGLICSVLVNGISPMGDATTGNLFFDVFEYYQSEAIVGSFTRIGINIISIIAYVAYMNHLKASTLFALMAANPIQKIKNKNILVWAVYMVTALLLLVVPNGTGRIALLMGTVYPIMLLCGITKATAASCIFGATMYVFGPTNTAVIIAADYAGVSDFNLAQYFVQTEFPWSLLALLIGSIAFVISSKYFDKKENAETGSAEIAGTKIEELGIPKYYAVFPMIPLVVILIFSGIIPGLPTLSIPAAEWMCFFLVFAFVVATAKDKGKAFNDGFEVFKSMGNTTANILGIIFGATVFGAAITQIGGVNILLSPFINAGENINLAVFLIVTTIAGLLVGTVAVSNHVVYSILGPVYASIAASSGVAFEPLLMLLTNSMQFVVGFSPATAHVAMTSQASGVDILTIIKRTIPPSLCAVAVYVAVACVLA